MNKITLDGQMDRLFVDDRDDRVEALTAKARVPSYGSNSLHAPRRALTPDEAAIADRIGAPSSAAAGRGER